MGFKKVAKEGLFSGLRPTRWVGMDQIKENASLIGSLFKGLFRLNKKKDVVNETFEECMARFKMTEKDLKKRMQVAKQVVVLSASLSLGVFAYMIYMWSKGLVLSGIVCLMLGLLLTSYALREHFNLFQMKQKRLGCTYQEWWNSIFKKGAK